MISPVAVVVGGTKGIGLAMGRKWLTNQLTRQTAKPRLFLMGRSVDVSRNEELLNLTTEFQDCEIHPVYVDLTLPESISSAANSISKRTESLDYVFHTSGMLHNVDSSGKQMDGKPELPERSFRAISLEGMLQTFTLNTFAPALVIKEFSTLLKKSHRNSYRAVEQKKPPVFAALSARVGSIDGNKKGGWTSYRASKAALNMVLLNAHLEFSMGGKQKVIVMALHPGTVDTNLSKPFQHIAKRQYTVFTPEYSASKLVDICESCDVEHSGNFYAYDGEPIPW